MSTRPSRVSSSRISSQTQGQKRRTLGEKKVPLTDMAANTPRRLSIGKVSRASQEGMGSSILQKKAEKKAEKKIGEKMAALHQSHASELVQLPFLSLESLDSEVSRPSQYDISILPLPSHCHPLMAFSADSLGLSYRPWSPPLLAAQPGLRPPSGAFSVAKILPQQKNRAMEKGLSP